MIPDKVLGGRRTVLNIKFVYFEIDIGIYLGV